MSRTRYDDTPVLVRLIATYENQPADADKRDAIFRTMEQQDLTIHDLDPDLRIRIERIVERAKRNVSCLIDKLYVGIKTGRMKPREIDKLRKKIDIEISKLRPQLPVDSRNKLREVDILLAEL